MKTINKLPNTTIIAELLAGDKLSTLRYDLETKYWFKYNNNIWERLNDEEAKQLVFLTLKDITGIKSNLTVLYSKNVLETMSMISGIKFSQLKDDRIGRLIPFNNNVYNISTKKLISYKPEFYITHKLSINYNNKAKMDINIVNYLIHISNNNLFLLKIIRNFIYLTLIRENKYQLALYLCGTAGSGKSIFEDIMMSLIGKKYAKTTTFKELLSSHGTTKLLDSCFVLFPDIIGFKGDASKLKNLISGGMIDANPKYKDHIDFKANSMVLFTSNLVWSPNDPTNGLQRRIIYLTINNKPAEKDVDLFRYDYDNDKCSGKLSNSLSGLINWVLDTPKEDLELFNIEAIEINKLTAPFMNHSANPLLEWVETNLVYDINSKLPIGVNNSDTSSHLWANYLKFCRDRNLRILSYNDFSMALLQQLDLLYGGIVTRQRSTSNVFITNIRFRKINEEIIKFNQNINPETINIEETFGKYIN